MAALCYEKIAAILEQAYRIDRKCELFGASKHQYRLNPPINAAVVRAAEEKYHFTLPEDYFRFITQIANGGAGRDYGVRSFEESLMSHVHNDYREAYRNSLKRPFTPRPMMPEEVERYGFHKDYYKRYPDKFFVYTVEDEADICITDGFFEIGTHGCQWDYGLIVSGERKGQVFVTDNEGGYLFQAYSFQEFYQEWLDWLSDPENIQKELDRWRELLKKTAN